MVRYNLKRDISGLLDRWNCALVGRSIQLWAKSRVPSVAICGSWMRLETRFHPDSAASFNSERDSSPVACSGGDDVTVMQPTESR